MHKQCVCSPRSSFLVAWRCKMKVSNHSTHTINANLRFIPIYFYPKTIDSAHRVRDTSTARVHRTELPYQKALNPVIDGSVLSVDSFLLSLHLVSGKMQTTFPSFYRHLQAKQNCFIHVHSLSGCNSCNL